MSLAVMNNVWSHCRLDGTHLIAMLALADWSNDQGECDPSYNQLAKKIRRTPRQTRRIVARLIDLGEIRREVCEGRDTPKGKTNLYVLDRYAEAVAEAPARGDTGVNPSPARGDASAPPTPERGGADDPPRGDTHVPHYSQSYNQEPGGDSENPPGATSDQPSARPSLWQSLAAEMALAVEGRPEACQKSRGKGLLADYGNALRVLGGAADDDPERAAGLWRRFVDAEKADGGWTYVRRASLVSRLGRWLADNRHVVQAQQSARPFYGPPE